jgi:hypothetical protein
VPVPSRVGLRSPVIRMAHYHLRSHPRNISVDHMGQVGVGGYPAFCEHATHPYRDRDSHAYDDCEALRIRVQEGYPMPHQVQFSK